MTRSSDTSEVARSKPAILVDAQTRSAFEVDAKIGLLATVDTDGLPHVTLITSLQAGGPTGLMFGQFSEGRSKKHVRENPRVAFLVLTRDRRLWRGRADWVRCVRKGEEYELYNQKPMFRYNAYSGIHTVHYLDLLGLKQEARLPWVGVVLGSLLTRLVRPRSGGSRSGRILTPWAERHLSNLGTLKFICTVGEDGYPKLVPLVPCRAAGSHRVVWVTSVFPQELRAIAVGTPLAIFAINQQMESVLVRGRLAGRRCLLGIDTGQVDLDWVYNSMPPKQGVIYPREALVPQAADVFEETAIISGKKECAGPTQR